MQTQVVLWDDLSSDVREGATFVVSYFSDVREIKAIISHCQSVVLCTVAFQCIYLRLVVRHSRTRFENSRIKNVSAE